MLDQDQIELVHKMCRVPASGSPIMIGIWAVDTNRNIDAIMGDIKHERFGARATAAIRDKSIAVITDFWPEHEGYWMDMVGKYRFRNQLIFMLDPYRKYSPQWLSRLAIINDRPGQLTPIDKSGAYTPPVSEKHRQEIIANIDAMASRLRSFEPMEIKVDLDDFKPGLDVVAGGGTELVHPAAWQKSVRFYTTLQTNHRDARNFIKDVAAKYDLRAEERGDGLTHVSFYKADGTVDDRFEVTFLYQDAASINMILGEI